MDRCGFALRKLYTLKQVAGWIWSMRNVLYTNARQAHFSDCFLSTQCKEQLEKPLPPQYALELLTVYAWEQGCKETGFNTAQGFQTVLQLVLKYQKLCIYWEKNYNSENPIIEEYLTKQLAKPRYSIRSCLSSLHKWTPAYSCCTLEMKELGGFHINWSSSDTYHAAGHFTSIIQF